jgi:hypothetical protein
MENNPTAGGTMVQPLRETEKKGGVTQQFTRVYPRVKGGTCEKCGVIDKNAPAEYQYKLCEHYRGLNLECSYCEASKDQKEVTRISDFYVYDHPAKRDSFGRPVLGVVCDSFTCQNSFNVEFGK